MGARIPVFLHQRLSEYIEILDKNIGQGDSIDIVKKFVVEDMITRDDKDGET